VVTTINCAYGAWRATSFSPAASSQTRPTRKQLVRVVTLCLLPFCVVRVLWMLVLVWRVGVCLGCVATTLRYAWLLVCGVGVALWGRAKQICKFVGFAALISLTDWGAPGLSFPLSIPFLTHSLGHQRKHGARRSTMSSCAPNQCCRAADWGPNGYIVVGTNDGRIMTLDETDLVRHNETCDV